MPPLGGIGEDGPDISDLQPLITSVAIAVIKKDLIHFVADRSAWLFFMVLPSRSEVWRLAQMRRNYWV